ncbi:hypothetical protein BN903_133 [Halorubrum sp. AJ67]|nr:hypothetical protein BN903_133 [Halorubrum sp. AJ67]
MRVVLVELDRSARPGHGPVYQPQPEALRVFERGLLGVVEGLSLDLRDPAPRVLDDERRRVAVAPHAHRDRHVVVVVFDRVPKRLLERERERRMRSDDTAVGEFRVNRGFGRLRGQLGHARLDDGDEVDRLERFRPPDRGDAPRSFARLDELLQVGPGDPRPLRDRRPVGRVLDPVEVAERDRQLVADVVAKHAVVDREKGRQLLGLRELFVGLHHVQSRPRADRRTEAGRERDQKGELERVVIEHPDEPDDTGERSEGEGGQAADPDRPPPPGGGDVPLGQVVHGVEDDAGETEDERRFEEHASASLADRHVSHAETGADSAERDEAVAGRDGASHRESYSPLTFMGFLTDRPHRPGYSSYIISTSSANRSKMFRRFFFIVGVRRSFASVNSSSTSRNRLICS